jgi:hypothetical protein
VTEEGLPTVKLEELFLLHVVPSKITHRQESKSKKMILLHHEPPVLSCGPVGDGKRLRKMDTVGVVMGREELQLYIYRQIFPSSFLLICTL